MVNRYRPHVWLIPEDDADRQLAVGFLNHEAVADRVVGVRAPAGGWHEVLDVFEKRVSSAASQVSRPHVVMLIDFDGDESRRAHFEARIADDVRPRVFVIGSKDDPETLEARDGNVAGKNRQGIGPGLSCGRVSALAASTPRP